MYVLFLTTPGEGARFVRTVLAYWGFVGVQGWKLPIEADILVVEVPSVASGRQLMSNLQGTLGLIDMWPLNFRTDVIALAPQLTLPAKHGAAA